jgi:hypothetical protein
VAESRSSKTLNDGQESSHTFRDLTALSQERTFSVAGGGVIDGGARIISCREE